MKLSFILIAYGSLFISEIFCGMVKVRIYDHRAEHDPIEYYGTGPWQYTGHGYGIEYQYEPDGTYERQRGYGFIKLLGREFCKPDSVWCRPSDPHFFDKLFTFNHQEPFWGQPAAQDVAYDHYNHQHEPQANYMLIK